ncbi:MAG: ABC transporter substrate-binding protein [Rhodospirillaceae bacterium]|nr:ABC transporter substrate-binding protein [Rhodospirillaceae bacterium]
MHATTLSRRAALAAAALLVAAPALAEMRTAPEPGKKYRIGFAQIVDHPALNATRKGFVDALKEAGFVEGKNLEFIYQNAQGDVGTARNIIQKFIADKVDLLAPCTTPLVLATLKLTQGSKIPVAFGCVTNPLQTGILKSTDKPTGTNVTGFYTIPPVKRNFDVILAIKPGIKTMGTIWNSGETNSEALNKLAKAEAEKRGIKWIAVTITSSAEILNAVQSLVGKVDAIVTPQDNTVASAYEAIVKVTRGAKIPWFSLDVLAVQRGAISAVAQHQYQNGVDWAKKVAIPVLLGKDPGTLVPVEAEVFEEHINTAAAKAVGLTVPDAVLKKATKVFDK